VLDSKLGISNQHSELRFVVQSGFKEFRKNTNPRNTTESWKTCFPGSENKTELKKIHQPLRIWNSLSEKLHPHRIENEINYCLKLRIEIPVQRNRTWTEIENETQIFRSQKTNHWIERKKGIGRFEFCVFYHLNAHWIFRLEKTTNKKENFSLSRQNINWNRRNFWIAFCCIFRIWFSESFVKEKFLETETGRNQENSSSKELWEIWLKRFRN